jgi:hypothetical protein
MTFSPPLLIFSGSRAWRRPLQAACFFLFGLPLLAQTVSPLITENIVKGPDKKAKNKIEYRNDTLETLTVTLATQSFTVSDTGDMQYRPLDGNIHVKFSANSFRIPPKQSYLVFYEAYADALPAWFVVYATFAGFKEKTEQGLNINILLPHTIYLLPKGEVKKDELVVKVAKYDPGPQIVTLRVENTGPTFCRVLGTDITSGGDRGVKIPGIGFPLFPHSQRQVDIPWSGKNSPAKLTLLFPHFHLEHSIGTAVP